MCEILTQCNSSNYHIVHQKKDEELNTSSNISVVEGSDDKINDIDKKVFTNTANDPLVFHESLNVLTLKDIDEVHKYYTDNINTLTMQFGVLLFLYTVIVTKVSMEDLS